MYNGVGWTTEETLGCARVAHGCKNDAVGMNGGDERGQRYDRRLVIHC